MKVKLLEHYQDAKQHLYPDKEYDVDATLGEWLLKNRKAVAVVDAPTFKHLEVEPQFEQAEEMPKPKSYRNRQRGEK